MTLQECYESMGADYQGVMGRLMKEERVLKFLKKAVFFAGKYLVIPLSWQTSARNHGSFL